MEILLALGVEARRETTPDVPLKTLMEVLVHPSTPALGV
jgi:hypothetical protein